MKPWSTKTLQNKYIKARINKDESIILHKYLLCFSNLYGCIQIQDLWDVFKQYKEKITREKRVHNRWWHQIACVRYTKTCKGYR